MASTVQDALDLIGDYTAADSGQNSQPSQIRAITQAVAYFQRKLALPSDEKTSSFYFSDDQFFYPIPEGFEEELDILYNDPTLNVSGNEWDFEEYSDLLKRSGSRITQNRWSFTTINGFRQIILIGDNIRKGSVIDELDSIGTWVASGDASGLAVDTLIKKYGDASLSFDITNSTGLATLTRTGMSLDVEDLFSNHGYFKLWTDLSDLPIDGIILKLYVDNSNYWTITATIFDDGSDFSAGSFQKVGWALDDAVKTGSPLITQDITKMSINFDLGVGFTSAVDFRIDHLFTSIPDYMDLIYRTSYKGRTEDTEPITKFGLVTDTIAICDYSELFLDLIARRASMQLFPGLRNDKEWYAIYQADLNDMMRSWGMRFPKRRTNKMHDTKLRR